MSRLFTWTIQEPDFDICIWTQIKTINDSSGCQLMQLDTQTHTYSETCSFQVFYTISAILFWKQCMAAVVFGTFNDGASIHPHTHLQSPVWIII